MKFVGVREAQQHLCGLLRTVKKQRIVLTRNGRPVAIVTGVSEEDLEDFLLGQDPSFCDLIRSRRRSSTPRVSHEKLVAETEHDLRVGEPRAAYRATKSGLNALRRGKKKRD